MRQNVFSIAPGLSFLDTLAEAILDGRVLRDVRPGADPLALAGVTVYVPSRRAARGLGAAFARALGGRAAILPTIRPLGEADETALFTSAGTDLSPVIDGLERRLLIARFVRAWKAGLNEAALKVLSGEEIVLPASAADALWLARDLSALLDEAENEGASLAGLATLAPERLADWWRLTLTFLGILTEFWPQVLADRGLVDGARAQNDWLRREAERLCEEGSAGPIVLAGSTATAPATIELMRAVANLPNGALVLPGLDRHLEDRGYDAIAVAASPAMSGTAPGHPQYGLKRILSGLLVPRDAVEHIALPDADPLILRERFVSDALRPAETTDLWGAGAGEGEGEREGDGKCAEPRHAPQALDGLALVEAVDEREEALAIACAMRDALSEPGRTVALTTPDRSLARRVVAELERFGIAANDSAGRPLAATPPGALLTLAVAVALAPGDPIALVGLLKHPLVRLGRLPGEARRAARAIEMIGLRGTVGVADGARLAGLYDDALAAMERHPARVARPVRLVPDVDRDLGANFARTLEAALRPLAALRGGEPAEIGAFGRAVTETLEALAVDPKGSSAELYKEEAGAALATFLSRLLACPETGFAFAPVELPDVVAALLAGETVRPRAGLSSRAFVWGALEARLQRVDTMVLGGLNEGTWPGRATGDAFLSRLMRAELSLAAPERRIGLAAHDVTMALGSPRVVMTRALRVGGAPSIASRWLQRMLTLAGAEGAARLRAEGATFLHHARGLDASGEAPRVSRPAPVPPVEKRPRRYSVTEVETLVRDPYAIYARRILRLEPMPDLIRNPGAADRGTLYHAILADAVRLGIDFVAEDAEARVLAIAREKFEAEALPADVAAIWWPRIEALAANYVAWERGRNDRVVRRFAEERGETAFADLDTILSGSADRIDVMAEGSIEIIDFKTGTSPSVKQARTLLAPQLPLEGAMAKAGAFPATKGPMGAVSDLLYVRLRERELYQETLTQGGGKTGEDVTGDSLSEEALVRFRGLAAQYLLADQPFVSRPRPFLAGDFSGPYDHLARAREWSVGADETGGEGGEGGE